MLGAIIRKLKIGLFLFRDGHWKICGNFGYGRNAPQPARWAHVVTRSYYVITPCHLLGVKRRDYTTRYPHGPNTNKIQKEHPAQLCMWGTWPCQLCWVLFGVGPLLYFYLYTLAER